MAMLDEPRVQLPPEGEPIRNNDEPSHTVLPPVIGLGRALMVIGHTVWHPVDNEYTMFALPVPAPVTTPDDALTVAFGSEVLDHVPPSVRLLRAVWLPT